ncbi:MAG: PD-(D/E)XK nuclease family protein [Rikenellaceae bacterium]|nr:PD-(D/E)XK nuclease family protein [Rikenellaceae bacterium]
MNFLTSIASLFYQKEGSAISNYCFVFPNRRAGLFFQRAIASIAQEPLFSPRITTINDLFTQLSGFEQIDRIEALTVLWKNYNNISSKKESFDEFIFWGDIILSDFDDVDKYMVDAAMLFANIKDLREIESDYSFLTQRQMEAIHQFWNNFLPVGNSDEKQKFKAVWEVLSPLYESLTKELSGRSVGFEGMIYRKVASSIMTGAYQEEAMFKPLFSYRKVVFIGFNALNPCEKILMNMLKKRGVADFYWDYAGEMIKNKDNRSSFFMDENLNSFPSSMPLNTEEPQTCSIEVTGVPSSTGQAKRVMNIIKEVGGGINTAVVLPDESLLMPVIYSIPEEVEGVNVTMGYPLKQGSIVSLIESILELQRGVSYYRRVLPVLRHNYIRTIASEETTVLIRRIVKYNMVYINKTEFDSHPLFKIIFREVKDISSYLLEILGYMNNSVELGSIEKEFIYTLYTSVTKLRDLLPPVNTDTYIRILEQIINSTTIPFRGEPLSGLQIMGVLETRSLDFENVIICSMNEGVFPGKSFSNSFIPATLRRGFSLPDMEYNDTVSAYLFYRLISRANRVFMLYDTRSEGLKSGEISRYIYQLKYHFGLPIKESISAQRTEIPPTRNIVVSKSDEIIRRLCEMYMPGGSTALSASAINTYIGCPLRFYFQYIKGLKEEETVEEGVEAQTFGSIFHDVMNSLYSEFKGKTVTSEMLQKLLKDDDRIEKTLKESFYKIMNMQEVVGRNLLTKTLIKKYIRQTISFDSKITPFEYLDSEKTIETTIELKDGFSLKFKGIIDRLDKTAEGRRIVDYKTGSGTFLQGFNYEKMFSDKQEKGDAIMLQLILYAVVLDGGLADIIEPYMLRGIFKSKRFFRTVDNEVADSFMPLLTTKLSELFDKELPFSQTKNEKNCEYCPFNIICR